MLRLKELDASSTDASGQLLQTRFEEESKQFHTSDVTAVPSCNGSGYDVCLVRSTMKRGYVQAVRLNRQSFSVFLTHIDDIPMEATVRCLKFAPCLSPRCNAAPLAVGTTDAFPCMVVYTLAFSNQVLIADLNNGCVTVLDEYPCRPNCLFADSSVVAVGDGRGRVHVYRGSSVFLSKSGSGTPQGRESLMWSSAISLHPISVIAPIRHSHYVVGTANYNVCVLDAATGVMVSSLISEASPLVSVRVPALAPVYEHAVDLHYDSGVTCRFVGSHAAGSETWSLVSTCRLVPALACTAAILTAERPPTTIEFVGTKGGQVVLYEEAASSRRERTRIDVNAPVMSIHVLPTAGGLGAGDAPLILVSTASGDLWEWTMEELALTAEPADAADAEPSTCEVLPAPETGSRGASVGNDNGLVQSLVDDALAERPSTSPPPPGAARPLSPASPTSGTTGGGRGDAPLREEDDSVVIVMDDEMHSVAGTEATINSAVPSSVALTAATHNTTHDEMLRQRHRPNANVRFAETIEPNSGVRGLPSTGNPVDDLNGGAPGSGGEASSMALTHIAAANTSGHVGRGSEVAHQRRRGDAVAVIPGLKQGKRWDPRLIRSVLDRCDADSFDRSAAPLANVEDQSTLAVEAEEARLAAETFEYERFAAQHQMEARALRYQHPIRGETYQLNDVLFSACGLSKPLFVDGGASQPAEGEGSHENKKQSIDDLVDATFNKYAQRREKQQRKISEAPAGPDPHRHLCHALLAPTPSCAPAAIFFTEHKLPPGAPALLAMPMPLPPSAVSAL